MFCDIEDEMVGFGENDIPTRKNLLSIAGFGLEDNVESGEQSDHEQQHTVMRSQDGLGEPLLETGLEEEGSCLNMEEDDLRLAQATSPPRAQGGGVSEKKLRGRKKKEQDKKRKKEKLAAAAKDWGTGKFKSLRYY